MSWAGNANWDRCLRQDGKREKGKRETGNENRSQVLFPVSGFPFPVSRSRYRILLRDVPTSRLRHHPELVEPHHRVVAHFQLEARLLLQLSQEVRLLLHEVQRHLRMEPHRELVLL